MTDRLALIKARHAEAGGGDGDKAWLIAEVERLITELGTIREECPCVRMQDHFDDTPLQAVRWTVSRLISLEVEAQRAWAEVKRLSGPPSFLDEALNSGRGVYRP